MVGGWGLHSHFHVQPNNSVEVVLLLCCVVVGVVTIYTAISRCFLSFFLGGGFQVILGQKMSYWQAQPKPQLRLTPYWFIGRAQNTNNSSIPRELFKSFLLFFAIYITLFGLLCTKWVIQNVSELTFLAYIYQIKG